MVKFHKLVETEFCEVFFNFSISNFNYVKNKDNLVKNLNLKIMIHINI